ncbi:MAG TPA: MinD/ParA family protein, partial [Candidatus Portnoybacteria bacterium]|nr:MinD/ParA family protein [Candidatus Portnoybacteria bacterium]
MTEKINFLENIKIPNKAKKIAITGGKGGTGKSTFVTLLSLGLAREGKKVILCD